MNSKTRAFFAGVTCNVLILFFATTAWGFQGFNESGSGVPSCSTCHTAFASGQGQHGAHAGLASGCNDCHGGSFNNNPPLDNCVQCHGRAEDAGSDSEGSGIGRGLRLHHVTMGAAACDSCHSDARSPTDVGENVLPSFYAAAGAAGLDSCDGSEEQFGSQTISLDNDGDGLTDGNDPDCATNVAPTASPNGPYNAVAGNAIIFSSDGSSDSDGTIVSFAWNFGDGNTGTGASPTHTYQSEGTITVSLTVTDNGGAQGSASTTATITPAPIPPTADAGGPYSGLVGSPVSFDSTASGDADGTVVAYAWDFGDGGVSSEPSPAHSYSVDGSFTVTLTVTDNDGLTGTDTTTATINPAGGNTPPIADANGPSSGTEVAAVQF